MNTRLPARRTFTTMLRRPISAGVVSAMLVLIAACSSGGGSPSVTATLQATPRPTIDVRQQIIDELPAYAGMFADESTEILYIYSHNPDIDVDHAREVLRANGVGQVAWEWERAVILPANSTALFAAWWSDLIAVADRVAEVTMVDDDEVNDKIRDRRRV